MSCDVPFPRKRQSMVTLGRTGCCRDVCVREYEKFGLCASALKHKNEGWKVSFFFPFQENTAATAALGKLFEYQPLPMLPAPRSLPGQSSSGDAFGEAVSYAGDFGVDLLRQIIGSFASSLTAISSRAYFYFSQLVAALAFERMARQAASLWGMGWQASGMPAPQTAFSGAFWQMPAAPPIHFSAFAWPARPMNPWMAMPSPAFSEIVKLWTSFWMPAAPQNPFETSAPRDRPPFTATASVPGCSWNVGFG
jgi:hypothetical protein